MKYKIYGNSNRKGWELIDTKTDKEKAIERGKGLDKILYSKYMIIEVDEKENSEYPIIAEDLDQKKKFRDELRVENLEESKIYRKMKEYIEENER